MAESSRSVAGRRFQRIQVRGLMLPWEVALDGVPNGQVFVEVVRGLCPRRLLEPA